MPGEEEADDDELVGGSPWVEVEGDEADVEGHEVVAYVSPSEGNKG